MQRIGISLLVVGSLLVAVAYASAILGVGPSVAPWWLASGSTAVLAGFAAIGAARHGRSTPRLTAAIVVAFLSVMVGLLVPLARPAPDLTTPLLLGVPRPTAILLLFVGVVPLILLPFAYAAVFDDEVLSASDLDA